MSDPIRDTESAVRELGALPVPTGTATLTAEQRAAIAELIGDAKPATSGLLEQLAESVRNRREHDHPTWEDLYCLNLVSWVGERMGPVLRRLLDAEAERDSFREQRNRLAEKTARLLADLEAAREDHGRTINEVRTLTRERDTARARVAELETDLAAKLRDVEAAVKGWERARERIAELEAAQGTVYRASHDSIVMGLYTTAAEARKHCETEMRREYDESNTKVSLWWREDEDTVDQPEDGEAELYVHATPYGFDSGRTWRTGYVVTPLELASEYDEEADE